MREGYHRGSGPVLVAALALLTTPATAEATSSDVLPRNDPSLPFSRDTQNQLSLSFLNRLPGGKLEFSLGQSLRVSLGEHRRNITFAERGIELSHIRLSSNNQPDLSITGARGTFSLGVNQLQVTGLQAQDPEARFDRQQIGFSGRGFSLNAERLSVDKDFKRISELEGVSTEERAAIEAERGWSKIGVAGTFTPLAGVSLSTQRYQRSSLTSSSEGSGFRDLASVQFSPSFRASYLSEGSSAEQEGGTHESRTHQNFSLALKGKNLFFAGSQDITRTIRNGDSHSQRISSLHVQSNGEASFQASMQRVETTSPSLVESNTVYDIGVNAIKGVSFRGTLHEVKRSHGESFSNSQVNIHADLPSGFGVRALFELRSSNTNPTRQVSDISLSAKRPGLEISGRALEIRESGDSTFREQGLSMSGVTLGGNLTFFGSFKSREGQGGDARSMTARARYALDPNSHLSLAYSLRPENEQGQFLPRNDVMIEYQTNQGGIRYGARYVSGFDYQTGKRDSALGVMAQGTLTNGASISGHLGYELEDRHGFQRTTPRLDLSYESRTSADDSVNLQVSQGRSGLGLKLEMKKKF